MTAPEMWKQKTIENKIKILFNTLRIYITIYHTYFLLHCKGNIQITSNDRTINEETKNRVKKDKVKFNTIRIYITIYHTYQLLCCKGHIQMTSNDSTRNVETKNNRVNKMIKLHSIQIEFTLQYITLTSYYIVKYIFRLEVVTVP